MGRGKLFQAGYGTELRQRDMPYTEIEGKECWVFLKGGRINYISWKGREVDYLQGGGMVGESYKNGEL